MARAPSAGRGRLAAFAVVESWRLASYRLHASPLLGFRYSGRAPERLLIAPTDLRTADPTIAVDIYAGRFVLAGQPLDAGGESVFTVDPPSLEWVRALHGFDWLRHLRASDMTLSGDNARALIADWIRIGRREPVAWEPEVAARRLISWLSQTPLILEGSDLAFYRRFMRSLARQIRHLRRIAPRAPPGMPRLLVMIALSSASLAVADQERFIKQAARWLDGELARQILPDGGHASRNPGAVLDLLVDLLPLRQAFTARGIQPSRTLVAAIDRMMPMIRFFRHADGSFARFNGMGDTPTDLVATVLAYDDARGKPVSNAPHSGYQRVTAGTSLLLMDTGRPPPVALSGAAHAGCLSFEFSVGRQPMIVNCGNPGPRAEKLRRLARTTAAHSTATVNDTSSCRFLRRPGLSERFGEVILAGPANVTVERGQEPDGTVVIASHDGYVPRYGLVHERRLTLSPTGDRLEGIDTFMTPSGGQATVGKDSYAIRFHLHPRVEVTPLESGRIVELTLPEGELWVFESPALDVAVEDSILFSDIRASRPSTQLVLYGLAQYEPRVQWRFRRIGFRGTVRLPRAHP